MVSQYAQWRSKNGPWILIKNSRARITEHGGVRYVFGRQGAIIGALINDTYWTLTDILANREMMDKYLTYRETLL